MDSTDVIQVIGLVPNTTDCSPGQRYRIEQWQPYLERHGIEISLEPFESEELAAVLHASGRTTQKAWLIACSLARRLQTLQRAQGQFHCAYVYREASLLGPALDRWLPRLGLPYVYDFDDAIFLRGPSSSNGYLNLLKNPTKTRVSCRRASHVMAGNAYLAEYARRHNTKVSIVPSTIDLEKYQANFEGKDPARRPVIGWSGSNSTAPYLDIIVGALRRLATERDFEFLVIGAPDYRLEGVNARVLPWRSESEVADLKQMDIGIMPLPDNRWARGKCGMKLLQYMAGGIAAVASPVGVNRDIIEHGSNGLLAVTEDEWVSRLRDLVDSPELRRRLAVEGRRTVEDRFDGEAEANHVAAIFRGVVGARA